MEAWRTPPEVVAERYEKAFNIPIKQIGDGFEFDLPGWSFGDFCRTGKLGFWNVCRLMETHRMFTGKEPWRDDKILLINASKMKVSRYLSNVAALDFPMEYRTTFGHIGNRSFTTVTTISEKKTSKFLANFESRIVFVDPDTKKATTIPKGLQMLKTKYTANFFNVASPVKPKDGSTVYRYDMEALASDMDERYCVNQASYYKFCFDAAYEAGKAGHLPTFVYDVCEYDVKETEARHFGDVTAGDKLDVLVWEGSHHDGLALCCEIYNANGQNVYTLCAKFHDYVTSNI